VWGEVGLAHLDFQGRAEIGFWVAPEHRGKGAAAAAVGLVTAWALAPPSPPARPGSDGADDAVGAAGAKGLGRTRLWARTVPGDARAAAVLERAGYQGRGEAGGSWVWTIDAASLRA
jgi:RimJ/RimL family protein N-acetyltransferase